MIPSEDGALCRAHIKISVDSVNSANQTTKRLWESVVAKYHEQPGIQFQELHALSNRNIKQLVNA